MSRNKDLEQLLRRARRSGWMTERRGAHRALVSPDGHRVWVSLTPSDPRAVRNTRAFLRKHGLEGLQ